MNTEQLHQSFLAIFGAEADATFFSPGRINLIGEHTDYNGGHVFPAAITLGTYGAARKREDQVLRFYSANFEAVGIVTLDVHHLVYNQADHWTNYAKGVLKFYKRQDMSFIVEWMCLCMGISRTDRAYLLRHR